jgi:AraC-like DNA-binding protein
MKSSALSALPSSLAAYPAAGRKIHIQAIASALTAREWSLTANQGRDLSHAILVTAGRGHLVRAEGAVEFAAPVLVWVPPRKAERLHLRAGGAGYLLAISDDLLAASMDVGAESIALWQTAGRMLTAAIARDDTLADLRHSFAAIERELARGEPGSWTSVTAHVALIKVGLWRASGAEAAAGHSRGVASAILHRFRYLVEMHFRDHWPIPRYAGTLAVSADRLHAICLRELERSPLKLVHERLMREAMVLLERSMLTVEQVSNHLGFKDPAHFNRFFKAHAGTPPGAFRAGIEKSATRLSGAPAPHSYADWP